ncbi:tumor necrosis factor receptor superfamily member 17 [Choloepus didactylus]|uniref:tumor necrosis factor receptor superfamily member 17 n=1 Tax=Choloepus didactylus TaxID=27675 RepID=UPI0018A04116|nr:tumor necrosis factor receptor superfamily member 17 [Choloepus didactylus]
MVGLWMVYLSAHLYFLTFQQWLWITLTTATIMEPSHSISQKLHKWLPKLPLHAPGFQACLHLTTVTWFQMAQQCFQHEYFDSLLHTCKPCHLRCSNTPPLTCQRYCNASVTKSVKGTNAILWTCLAVGLILCLAFFVLMFLLKKMSSEQLKDNFKNTGSALREAHNAELANSMTGAEVILPRGLGYTVEECTCEDCVKSKPKADSDQVFPLPAMEEGATLLVTTKTNDYCNSLSAAASVTGI